MRGIEINLCCCRSWLKSFQWLINSLFLLVLILKLCQRSIIVAFCLYSVIHFAFIPLFQVLFLSIVFSTNLEEKLWLLCLYNEWQTRRVLMLNPCFFFRRLGDWWNTHMVMLNGFWIPQVVDAFYGIFGFRFRSWQSPLRIIIILHGW